MYVIVAKSHAGARVIGPFGTIARASGRGLELFGPLTFGCPVKWRVARVEADERTGRMPESDSGRPGVA